jgi:hypothetical protein
MVVDWDELGAGHPEDRPLGVMNELCRPLGLRSDWNHPCEEVPMCFVLPCI